MISWFVQLYINVFWAGSFTGDVLRLLANGLGTAFLNNCHDNTTWRKGTGEYNERLHQTYTVWVNNMCINSVYCIVCSRQRWSLIITMITMITIIINLELSTCWSLTLLWQSDSTWFSLVECSSASAHVVQLSANLQRHQSIFCGRPALSSPSIIPKTNDYIFDCHLFCNFICITMLYLTKHW